MYVKAMFDSVEGILAKILKEHAEDRTRVDELYQWPLQLHQVTDRLNAVEKNFVTKTACGEELQRFAEAADINTDNKLEKLRGELNIFENQLKESEAYMKGVSEQFQVHTKGAFVIVENGYLQLKEKMDMVATEARTTAAAASATRSSEILAGASAPPLQAAAMAERIAGLEERLAQQQRQVQILSGVAEAGPGERCIAAMSNG